MKESELLEELAKELYIPPIEPDEVTAQQLANRLGMGYQYVANQLKNKVAAGELTVRTVKMPDGKRAKAYRKSRA